MDLNSDVVSPAACPAATVTGFSFSASPDCASFDSTFAAAFFSQSMPNFVSDVSGLLLWGYETCFLGAIEAHKSLLVRF